MRTTAYLKAIMEVYGKTFTGLSPKQVNILLNKCEQNTTSMSLLAGRTVRECEYFLNVTLSVDDGVCMNTLTLCTILYIIEKNNKNDVNWIFICCTIFRYNRVSEQRKLRRVSECSDESLHMRRLTRAFATRIYKAWM